MPTLILPKFSTPVPITITLGGLANGSAQQGALYDNSSTRHDRITVYAKVKLGTSPVANGYVGLYLIRDDGAGGVRDDGAGAVNAAITLQNAWQFGSLKAGTSPATGDVLQGSFALTDSVGPKFTIAVLNATGVALDATSGNHLIEFVGESMESQ